MFFLNKARQCAARTENIIKKDKKIYSDQSLCDVIKSDIISVLSNYIVIKDNTPIVEINMQSEEDFEIIFKANCVRYKSFFECKR